MDEPPVSCGVVYGMSIAQKMGKSLRKRFRFDEKWMKSR